jgi:glycosyltransferase involved in cell wall biosynthesis
MTNADESWISVLLISRGEDTLDQVLSSISNQSRRPREVILVDSAPRDSRIPECHGISLSVIKIAPAHGILTARSTAIKQARGEFSLLLDSTRPLRPNCLESLQGLDRVYDMAILAEGSIGDGLFPRLAQLDKNLAMSRVNVRAVTAGRAAFAIPRFFRTELLKSAVRRLESTLSPMLYDRVRHGDHQLIFQECLKDASAICAVSVPLLDHYEDRELSLIVKKYFGYGRSHRMISKLGLAKAHLNARAFIRDTSSLSLTERAAVSLLYFFRGLSFYSGYATAAIARDAIAVGPSG